LSFLFLIIMLLLLLFFLSFLGHKFKLKLEIS
jgi:hypothetical protein